MGEKQKTELRTVAYVLRRTNYGEADRILSLITPEGKIAAMAKGVRKARSKLAGGVEMFTLTEVNLHFGRGDLATLTGAKMLKFHKEILKDLERMELAGEVLKRTERAAEGTGGEGYFEIVKSVLTQLDEGVEPGLAAAWFMMKLAMVMGEQINFYTDVAGDKLASDTRYDWDANEMAFRRNAAGMVDENGIKILRLMVTADLAVVRRIRGIETYLPEILKISKVFEEVVK